MTDNQKIFVQEYMKDMNGTRAYMVAYPAIKKEETAAAAASRMLRNVKVKAYLQELMQEVKSKNIATIEDVLEFYTRVLTGSETSKDTFLDLNGVEVEVTKYPTIPDKHKAADSLGRYYSLFTDKVEHNGGISIKVEWQDDD